MRNQREPVLRAMLNRMSDEQVMALVLAIIAWGERAVTGVYSDHLTGSVIIVDLDAEEVGEPVTAEFCWVERLCEAAQQTKDALKEAICD